MLSGRQASARTPQQGPRRSKQETLNDAAGHDAESQCLHACVFARRRSLPLHVKQLDVEHPRSRLENGRRGATAP